MCFTPIVSLVSFIVSVISCFILFTFGSPPLKAVSIYAAFVGFMQLYDYIFWNTQSKNMTNRVVTKIAMLTNNLQPIVLATVIFALCKQRRLKMPMASVFVTAMYSICAVVYTMYCWNNVDYTLVSQTSYPSLHWLWICMPHSTAFYVLFIVTMAILFIQNFPTPLNVLLTFLYMMTLAVSFYYVKNKSVGRFWCYFAAYIPFLLTIGHFICRAVTRRLHQH